MRSRLGLHAARAFISPWLLWLALVIPFVQTAASVHAISHIAGEAQQRDAALVVASTSPAAQTSDEQSSTSSPAPLVDHCPLCVFAATLGHGAPIALPTPWVATALQQTAPQTVALPIRAPARASAYLSRAPPRSIA